MLNALRRLRSRFGEEPAELRFDRPLLLIQSDDWGRVGVRDREGWQELQSSGIELGEKPYDFYSLETAEDLQALRAILEKHRDSIGRNPVMGMNFIMANVDFDRCLDRRETPIPLVPLSEGLPAKWHRPHLLEAYRQGIDDGVFSPALHGLTHFSTNAVARELEIGGDRAQLILKMWQARTPYIYWRMPWVGYEYWDPAPKSQPGFLLLEAQHAIIQRAVEIYKHLFSAAPRSACAPGYRANADTAIAWSETGVRVIQHGPGQRQSPYLDQHEILHTFRNVEIEPAIAMPDPETLFRDAAKCLDRGLPAVVSIHSINFHSTIRNFRDTTLPLLDDFLCRIGKRWPNLLYVHDGDLWRIVTEGSYSSPAGKVEVGVGFAR